MCRGPQNPRISPNIAKYRAKLPQRPLISPNIAKISLQRLLRAEGHKPRISPNIGRRSLEQFGAIFGDIRGLWPSARRGLWSDIFAIFGDISGLWGNLARYSAIFWVCGPLHVGAFGAIFWRYLAIFGGLWPSSRRGRWNDIFLIFVFGPLHVGAVRAIFLPNIVPVVPREQLHHPIWRKYRSKSPYAQRATQAPNIAKCRAKLPHEPNYMAEYREKSLPRPCL